MTRRIIIRFDSKTHPGRQPILVDWPERYADPQTGDDVSIVLPDRSRTTGKVLSRHWELSEATQPGEVRQIELALTVKTID